MRYRDNIPLVAANSLRLVYLLGSYLVLQLYMKDLGASPFQISLLAVIFWGGMLLFAPLWGALSDASGRRKVFLVASVLAAALVIPLYGLAASIPTVLGLRAVFAVVTVAFPPIALAAMSAHSDSSRRGRSLAPYHTSRALGFLLGWGGSGILLDHLGFQLTFHAFGAIGILGFLAALLITDVDAPEPVSLREVWRKARKRWVPSRGDSSLTSHGLQYLFAGIFLRKAGLIGISSLIAVYAVDVLGLSASLMGILLALNPVAQLLFLDLFGTIADRHGRRKVLLLGFLGTVPAPFLLTVASNPVVFGITYILWGFSYAAIVEGSTAFVGDVAPDDRQGEIMGFRKSSQGLAGVVGPLVAGTIATLYGYTVMLYYIGFLTLLGFIAVWYGTDEPLEDVEPHTSLRHDVYDTFMHFRR